MPYNWHFINGVGKYVSVNSREGTWGSGAIDIIADQLHKELPGLRGFSRSNIKNMRSFYEEWKDLDGNSPAMAGELQKIECQDITISPAVAGEFKDNQSAIQLPSFGTLHESGFLDVPFTHHCIILSDVKDREQRLYYIRLCATQHLTKRALKKAIAENAFEHKQIPNNFSNTLPTAAMARKAVDTFKDEYLLDFINVEEIGERDIEDIDERVIENKIVHNVKNFIMTFGKDFTFVGNQYHLEVYGVEQFPDLLFFNRALNCLVCVELKKGEFKPAYLGQLTTYLRILDDKVKKEHENPSIGIILCSDFNKDFVQYIIQDYKKPMGVARYTTLSEMPEKLKNVLPDMQELRNQLKNNKEA